VNNIDFMGLWTCGTATQTSGNFSMSNDSYVVNFSEFVENEDVLIGDSGLSLYDLFTSGLFGGGGKSWRRSIGGGGKDWGRCNYVVIEKSTGKIIDVVDNWDFSIYAYDGNAKDYKRGESNLEWVGIMSDTHDTYMNFINKSVNVVGGYFFNHARFSYTISIGAQVSAHFLNYGFSLNAIAFDIFKHSWKNNGTRTHFFDWIGKNSLAKITQSIDIHNLGIGQSFNVKSYNYGEDLRYVTGSQSTDLKYVITRSTSINGELIFSITGSISAIIGIAFSIENIASKYTP
jgi:hypothetical protein